jgi:hypothetical protein
MTRGLGGTPRCRPRTSLLVTHLLILAVVNKGGHRSSAQSQTMLWTSLARQTCTRFTYPSS